MAYLVFEEQGECYLLVAAAAIDMHPVFFANLLSSSALVADAQGRQLDALAVWEAVATGRWQRLLAHYHVLEAPPALRAALQSGVLAIKRTVARKDGVYTIFHECDGAVWVLKCTQERAAGAALLGEPIFAGVAYDIHLRQLAACGDWSGWRQALFLFVEDVFVRFALTEDSLQGEAIDLLARNAVLDEQENIAFFDVEFADYEAPSKTFFIYRLSLSLVGRRAEYLAGSGFTCRYELYCHLCKCFALDASTYIENVRREAAFQAWVSGKSIKRVKYFKGLQPFALKQPLGQKLRRLRYALRLLAQRYR